MRLLHSVVFTLAALAALAASSAHAGPLRLNEIVAGPARDWDGSGVFSSRDDEWVEILNTSAGILDLGSFYLTDADSVRRYSFTGLLAPGEVRLVTGKAAYDWERANGFSAVGLSLSNSGDSVLLWQTLGADSVIVDSYTYRSHEAAADRASGRDARSGEWQLFDSLNPYTGTLTPAGNHCAPTPGQPNLCSSTPAERTTWGRVKTLYR